MKFRTYSVLICSVLIFLSRAEASSPLQSNLDKQAQTVSPMTKPIYQIDFKKQKTIPQGWRIPGNNAGTIAVQAGYLKIDGRHNAMQPTSVLLPDDLKKWNNYRIDMEFSLDQPLNSSRWGSLMYDIAIGQGYIPQKYFQFTIRQDATAKNGTEFGSRLKNGQWNVQATAPFTEKLKANQIYQASIVVQGNRVQHILNGHILQNVELDQPQLTGEIGLSAAGLMMNVSRISVYPQNIALPSLPNKSFNIQNLDSQVAAPPTLIQKMTQADKGIHFAAQQQYYRLDAQLNLLDSSNKEISHLSTYLNDAQRKTIPVFDVNDSNTLEALKKFSKHNDISDITIMSKDPDILISAHQILPEIRTALDFSQRKALKNDLKQLNQIIQSTNRAYAKILVLAPDLVNKYNAQYLQRRLMTVWVNTSTMSALELAKILTSGVNGILTPSSDQFSELLKQFPKNTLLRQPLIIGHRGVPSLEDENTLESAKHAVALGADLVENDIYLTKDQHLVVMHDETVDRTTKSTGKIEEMTLAEVQQLRTKNKNYHIPTLAEYFKTFKKNKNFVLMVEMKSANPQLVPALKAEIEKYDVADQVVTTSFHRDQIQRMKAELPSLSTGILVANLPKSINTLVNSKQVVSEAQQYSSSYHPPYRQDIVKLFNITQHRGVTYWPWNLDNNTFKQLYLAGLNGVTTNYIQLFSKYIVDVETDAQIKAKIGQPVIVDVKLKQQDGTLVSTKSNILIILANAPKYQIQNGQISFTEKGIAHVLVGYKYQIDAQNFYHIFSAPMKVQVK